MMQFSERCPEDCPPEGAAPTAGAVYRFVKSNPAAPNDFRSWADMNRKPGQGNECSRCAISVLITLDDVKAARRAIPAFRTKLIAVAEMSPEQGRLAQTGNNEWHHALWVERSLVDSLHVHFKVVAS